MNRPAPITALDAALSIAVTQIDEADAAVAAFLDEHIATLDAYRDLTAARAAKYDDVRSTERAILDLGYDVLYPEGGSVPSGVSILGNRGYSDAADEEAARDRAAESEPPFA